VPPVVLVTDLSRRGLVQSCAAIIHQDEALVKVATAALARIISWGGGGGGSSSGGGAASCTVSASALAPDVPLGFANIVVPALESEQLLPLPLLCHDDERLTPAGDDSEEALAPWVRLYAFLYRHAHPTVGPSPSESKRLVVESPWSHFTSEC
jgi:hypothetical protein